MKCCNKTIKDGGFSGIEYPYTHPEHYDGISEWVCNKCKKRYGRWTLKELKEGEFERRYGNA